MTLYRSEKNPPARFKAILNFFLIAFSITFLAGFAGYQVFRFINKTRVEKYFINKETFAILLLGIDEKSKKDSVKFISVAGVHPATARIGFVSFFPQTRLKENERTLGERISTGHISDVSKDLGGITGYDVTYYLTASVADVIRLVDLIEGVPYFLWSPDIMKNESLPMGEFILDGSLVERLISVPDKNEYSTAFQLFRNYSFLLNLWQVRKQKWDLLKNERIFSAAVSGVNTNLKAAELYYLGDVFFNEKGWLVNFMEAPLKRIKDNYFLDNDSTALYLKGYSRQLTQKENPFAAESPKMEIKNGTEVPNLARTLRGQIIRKGVQVLEFTNADRNDYKKSVLLNTSGQAYYLESAAKILGVQNTYHAVNRSLFTDLVLILGNDYKHFKLSANKQ